MTSPHDEAGTQYIDITMTEDTTVVLRCENKDEAVTKMQMIAEAGDQNSFKHTDPDGTTHVISTNQMVYARWEPETDPLANQEAREGWEELPEVEGEEELA
jgi:hypothetical protein